MRIHNRFFIPLILYISILYLVTTVQAAQVELMWEPSPSQVAGYVLYYGTSSKGNAQHPDDFTYEFSEVIEDPNATGVTLEALPDGEMYYFSATAFDADGEESDFSNEVSTMIGSEVLSVVAVQASGDDGNVPANTLDGDFSTRWSANGQGQWLELDLGSVHTVGQVAIAWYRGDQREAVFDFEVSSDGVNWTPVFSGVSSGTTTDLETFSFSPVAARFVRYVGLGNSSSTWNSITEVQVFTPSDTEPPTPEPPIAELPVVAVQASGDDGNRPTNTLDGDFGTRWSANGQGQWLELDLGSVHTVGQVAIAWYLGDRREAVFDLAVSSDGVNWTPVLRDQHSSGTTTELETFSFSPVAARFVRYVGLGNSSSTWNSITEIQLFGF